MSKKNIVVLTGAGISKESGIPTFRDSNGTWENHNIDDVATPRGWIKNPELVLEFYNKRRKQLQEVEPNEGHKQLARLEEKYIVNIITQNVDNLHERAGSQNILHIHGELTKARGSLYNNKTSPLDNVIDIGYNDINIGDKCPVNNTQLRPNVVWFGENVDLLPEAQELSKNADIFIIIGTSLNVYPAADLFYFTKEATPIYLIDPNEIKIGSRRKTIKFINKTATEGVKEVVDLLMNE